MKHAPQNLPPKPEGMAAVAPVWLAAVKKHPPSGNFCKAGLA